MRKLLRIARRGVEKPAIVDDDGEIHDASIVFSEVDRALLSSDWPPAIDRLDRRRLPLVDRTIRRAACLEYHARLFAIGSNPAASWPTVALFGGRVGGANDPIMLSPVVDWSIRSGFALVMGGDDNRMPNIAGICMFVAVVCTSAGIDARTRAVASSFPDAVSLGPYLVRYDEWRTADTPVATSVNGVSLLAGARLGASAVNDRLASLHALTRLRSGDVVLFGALDEATDDHARLCPGDRITARHVVLGEQTRMCEAAAERR